MKVNANSNSNANVNYHKVGKKDDGSQKPKSSIFIAKDNNGNGIIDEEDFSREDLDKIKSSGLLHIFKKQKWTDKIINIFDAIFNKAESKLENKIIRTSIDDDICGTTHIIYDSSTRTLKFALQHENSDRYWDYQTYEYDQEGRCVRIRDYNPSIVKKDGKDIWIKDNGATYIALKEGFPHLGAYCDTVGTHFNIAEHMQNREKFIWSEEITKYDDKGNMISQTTSYPHGNTRDEMDNDGLITTYDYDNNIISQKYINLDD